MLRSALHRSVPYLFLGCALFTLTHAAPASEGVVGRPISEVKEQLGTPIGEINLGNQTIYYFNLGEIRVRDGLIVRADLISPAEYAVREKRAARHREEAIERAERLREQRIAEGNALREQRLGSSAFRALDAREQVRFWRQFQITYPEIDISTELQTALALFQAEDAERQRQAEIRRMQQRVNEAEAAAAAAQAARDADRARLEAARSRSVYSSSWGPVYQRPPVVVVPNSSNRVHVIHPNKNHCPSIAEATDRQARLNEWVRERRSERRSMRGN